MTSDLLGAIVAAARRSAEERERALERGGTDGQAAHRTPRGPAFLSALREPGLRIIAECKRRSPSQGVLRAGYDPAAIARAYEAAGAAAISVLTEPTFFDGTLDHLRAARAAVSLPLLRKDFTVTEFQVTEASQAGADAVLLIVAALDDPTLGRLVRVAQAQGLAALVEVHDRSDLDRALTAGAALVGVNSRNLRTLEITVAVFDELIEAIPDEVTAVAESGLKAHADLQRLREAGYDAFLIGERFMTAADPGLACAALKGAPPHAREVAP
jgi:indole-3-glycerol phosphate synthase